MATKKMDFKWLTENKTAIAIIASIGLLLAFYFLFWKNRGGGLFGLFGKGKSKGLDTSNDAKDEVKDRENNGEVLSYPRAQYTGWADSIYHALNGVGNWFDNENEAIRILKLMQKDIDVYELIAQFGARKGIDGFIKKGLPAFITDNIGKNKTNSINQYYASIGMDYRF